MNLEQIKTPKTTIDLGGRVYELKFTLSSMAELEEEYGSIDEALKVMEHRSIKAIRFFLWAGIMHEDENITPKQVGDMIPFNKLQECAEALGRAMQGAMPQEDKNKNIPGTNPNM